MKRKLAVALAVGLPFLYGCSKSSSQSAATASTDLGIVEVSTIKERNYPLSGGRDCTLGLTALADGQVLVEAVVLRKHGQDVDVLSRPRMVTRPGLKVTLPIGDGNIELIPKRI